MKYAVLILAALLSAHSYAGTEMGNGGDSPPIDEGRAWFVGPSGPMRVCYQLASDFGVSSQDVELAILQVAATWGNYFNLKSQNNTPPYPTNLQPNFQVQILPNCDGSEELTFYLGVTNSDVQAAATFYFNPIAFANKMSFDYTAGRGKGFVWVSNDSRTVWNVPYQFFGILLHEMGHVWGCEHNPGTIMTENIIDRLTQAFAYPSQAQSLLTQIDGDKEMVLNRQYFPGFSGILGNSALASEQATNFTVLTGKTPFGTVSASVSSVNSSSLTLKISDQSSSYNIPIQILSDGPSFPGQAQVFGVVRSVSNAQLSLGFSAGTGLVQFGRVTAINGTAYNALIERNTGEGISSGQMSPLRIQYSVGPQTAAYQDLFMSGNNP